MCGFITDLTFYYRLLFSFSSQHATPHRQSLRFRPERGPQYSHLGLAVQSTAHTEPINTCLIAWQGGEQTCGETSFMHATYCFVRRGLFLHGVSNRCCRCIRRRGRIM